MAKKTDDIFDEKSEKLKALQAAMSKIEKDFVCGESGFWDFDLCR